MRNLTIGFIGLGLIGGSIAKAIRRVHPEYRIIAFNRSPHARELALADGTCNIVTPVVDQTFEECDYIFLCTPVEYNVSYLSTLKEIISKNCIITDVGSVKTNIHEAVISLNLEQNFIGGHPMAGSEKTGYENASDRLVENAYYPVTPTSASPKERVLELIELIESIGAIPVLLDYKEHDRVVGAISHLPHIIAACLVNLVRDSDSKDGYMKLIAAGGFKDITRIASSSPEMWEQICMTNTTNISDFIQQYVTNLLAVKNSLDQHRGKDIYHLFETSRAYRNSFSDSSSGPIKKKHEIYCDIIDESGAIATIATILASHSISIKNIGILHNREFEEGVLSIEFYQEKACEDAFELLKKHNYHVTRH